MKLVKEIETKTYQTDESGEEHVLVEEVKQYHYDSKEETLEHAVVMKELGYEDTEQRKTNIGTITDPEIIWFGCYVKYHEEKVSPEAYDFKDMLSRLMRGDLRMKIGKTIRVPLKDGSFDEFVLTQEDDDAYRFESVTCIGGREVALNEVDELYNEYYALLPDALTNNLLQTKRGYFDKNGLYKEHDCSLFLPAASEVFYRCECDCGGLYEQLKYYEDPRNRIRKFRKHNMAATPWLVMPVDSSVECAFCNTDGSYVTHVMPWKLAIPVCFRIKKLK